MPKIKLDQGYTVILDAEHLTHRAYYAFTGNVQNILATSTGILSGTFFGFFSILHTAFETFGIKNLIVCWGDRRDRLARKDIYPLYKSGRSTPGPEYIEQVKHIQDALGMMGFTQYFAPRQEADDVIAQVVQDLLVKQDNGLVTEDTLAIYSGDKDLMQLVSDRVWFINSNSNGPDRVYLKEDVRNKFDVEPENLADFLSLMGDKADNIPGVPGIGEKTAAKLIHEFGPIKNWFHKIEELDFTERYKNKLIKHRQDMVVSKRLISLKNVNIAIQSLPFDSTHTADEIFDAYEVTKIRPYMFLF